VSRILGEEGRKRKSGGGFDGRELRGLITRSAVLVVVDVKVG
jgi:hypothetical protein